MNAESRAFHETLSVIDGCQFSNRFQCGFADSRVCNVNREHFEARYRGHELHGAGSARHPHGSRECRHCRASENQLPWLHSLARAGLQIADGSRNAR